MKKHTIKNTVLVLAVAVLTSFATSSFALTTLEGNSTTDFGKYTLAESENCVVMNNVAYKTWNLTYEGSNETYQVLYSPNADGTCCFLVRNDKFEIKYANEGNGFGVQLVEQGERTIKKKAIMKQINYDNFVSQLILTQKDKTEEEYLGLVASFMPLLFG